VAPLNNQPLTIYFVGGFFFGARIVPGFIEMVGSEIFSDSVLWFTYAAQL
jgi:hypothetical protein